MECAAQALSGRAAGGRERSRSVDDQQVRRRQPTGIETARRRRRVAASVLAGDHGKLGKGRGTTPSSTATACRKAAARKMAAAGKAGPISPAVGFLAPAPLPFA